MNLMMLLEMASSSFGDRVALTNGDRSLTYQQTFTAAGSVSSMVREANVERLAMLDVSSPAVPVALFGSAWAGVPFVPLNYRLTLSEVESLAKQIAPALLITDAERAPSLEKIPGIQVIVREEFLDRVAGDTAAETPDGPPSDWPMAAPSNLGAPS